MANLNDVLNERIARVARKVIKSTTGSTRRLAVQHRRDLAALKRQVQELTRRLAIVEKRAQRASGEQAPEPAGPRMRFSPKSVRSQRNRLGLSAERFGKLLGVTALTIYSWESGKFRPRREQLEKLGAIRQMGRRDANERLEKLDG